MIPIKNGAALQKMVIAGQRLSLVMQEVGALIKGGVSTLEIDQYVEKKMVQAGLIPVCKGYAGYKFATCISLNDIVIHGVPSDKIVLKSGDFVKIDAVASYKGYCVDMTRYFFVGKCIQEIYILAAVAQRALDKAIEIICPGKFISDISACIQAEVERAGFGIVKQFAGHGIGRDLHEDPEIPNFGEPGKGVVLREGMTLAIEPMITQGGGEVCVLADGWTVRTLDGGWAAHVEDTVAVVKGGARVLTRIA